MYHSGASLLRSIAGKGSPGCVCCHQERVKGSQEGVKTGAAASARVSSGVVIDTVVSVAIVAALMGYLVYALLHPDRF